MIDLHSHILPGIDDGAKHMTESVEMAREAVQQGITRIVATPHHMNGKYVNVKEDILPLVNELNDRLKKENISLEVLPGQECRIYGEILEDYEQGEILTLNNNQKYLFIELPSNSVPRYTEQLLFDIQVKGIVPIIVHPERNAELLESPDKLYQLVKKGACTQVTAASVVGAFGKKIKNFSHDIIQANLTHFIASDAHNIRNRTFKMDEAFQTISKEFGQDVEYLFIENAELLIEGQNIIKEVPERIKKKKFLGIF
ncbi:tyrosine-protein phosphatase [Sutcliffiella cohnii]